MSKTFDKIEQDFSDAGDDYVLDAAESEDSILDDVSDDDSPTGELFSRGEKNSDAFSSFSSQTTTVSDAHGDATSLKDVAHSISSYAHHRRRRLTRFTRRHRIAVGILSILFLAALSALVVAFVRTNDIPSIDAVTNDARTHVSTPTWSPGAYDADESLMLTGIEVGARSRTMTAISSEDAQFGATGYASAQVTTRYSGAAVVAVKTSTLGYANLSNSWKPIGQEKDTSVSFEATSGVATQKVLDAHEDLLKTLDEAHTSKGTSASYFDTYGHGSFDIVDASFDREKQTCSVVMRCTRSDKLSKISVDLRIDFAFDGGNGTWALANVGIAKNPTRDYGGLIGTWTGTFEKIESSNSGGRCYAGRYTPFSLTISSAEFTSDSTVNITGTVSGLVHDHGPVSGDYRAVEGDTPFSGLTFSASTDIDKKNELTPGGTIAFLGAYPNGTKNPWITLRFDDTDGTGIATVTSYHTEKDTTTTFTDTYRLSK